MSGLFGAGDGQSSLLFGGALLLIVQSVARLLEHGLYYVAVYVARLCFVTVDVDNSQQAFGWVSSYLAHLNEQGRMTTWGTLTIQNEIASAKQRRYSDGETSLSSKAKSSIFFLPGAGLHFLRVSWWRWVVVHKTAGETAGRGGEGQTKEVLWLGTLGRESFFREFVDEARAHSFLQDSESTVVYVQDGYRTSWKKALSKSKRSWESVILDGSTAEDVYQDCAKFLQSHDWYNALGVPYRRSFLIESPPGCGKSSFIQALAGRLGFDICFLSLSAGDWNDTELAEQLRATPPQSVVLLEDLDAAFPDRTKASREVLKKTKNKSLTLSGLLNALDGLVAAEGKLFFFTSNHSEQLDPALLRRADRVVSLKLASTKQIEQLFLRFHSKLESVARLYARSIPEYELSMSQIQGHLMQWRDKPVDAVSDVPNLLAEVRAMRKRRKEYEEQLLRKEERKAGEKKKGKEEEGEEGGEEEEPKEATVEMPALVGAPAADKTEEKEDAFLRQTVGSLDTGALEQQAAKKGATRRKPKAVDLTVSH